MNLTHFFLSLLTILNEMSPYILLGFVLAGLLHVFVRPEFMSRHLAGKGWKPVVKAALFGIPLPLCSCGVLPTAVSLHRQGASKGATASFLIATPQTGIDSIAATYSLLGLPFAIIRPVAALVGAVAGGWAVGLSSSDDGGNNIHKAGSYHIDDNDGHSSIVSRLTDAVRYGLTDMVESVGKWLTVGLFVAAAITVFVPDSLFLSLNRYPLMAMLVMVMVAVPMYICATGSIPVALSLMLKGLSPGVAFVLLMAGPAANFASILILDKSLGRRATIIYIVTVVVTAIVFGSIIDFVLPTEWFVPPAMGLTSSCCTSDFDMFEMLCSVSLVALLIKAAIYSGKRNKHCSITTDMDKEYIITGMSCAHCRASVEKAIASVDGVKSVTVDLGSGKAYVEGPHDSGQVIEAVHNAGFECMPKS